MFQYMYFRWMPPGALRMVAVVDRQGQPISSSNCRVNGETGVKIFF